MQKYVPRKITPTIRRKLREIPAVAIIGARQCGKTTLAKKVIAKNQTTIYLDLEKNSDRNKLQDPEAFLRLNARRLICLDEVQRVPELFPLLRSMIDENHRNGQFLILGSASPGLLKQSSETLAGRRQFRALMEARAVDIVMPDLAWCGGLSEARAIGVLADSFQLPLAPHDCTGPVVWGASCHLSLHASNALIQESVRAFYSGWYRELVDKLPRVEDGYISLDDGSGHGIELRNDRLQQDDVSIQVTDLS